MDIMSVTLPFLQWHQYTYHHEWPPFVTAFRIQMLYNLGSHDPSPWEPSFQQPTPCVPCIPTFPPRSCVQCLWTVPWWVAMQHDEYKRSHPSMIPLLWPTFLSVPFSWLARILVIASENASLLCFFALLGLLSMMDIIHRDQHIARPCW